MSDQLSISPCSCVPCSSFRNERKEREPEFFNAEEFEWPFSLPRVREENPKPFDLGVLVRVLEGIDMEELGGRVPQKKHSDVVHFFTYVNEDLVPFMNLHTLMTICEFLEDEDLESLIEDDVLARDFLTKAAQCFVLSWHAFLSGCKTAEYGARVTRRFMAAIVAVPKVSKHVIDVFTNKDLWPPGANPLNTLEDICEKYMACVDTASLLCNLTRIDKVPELLDQETKIVKMLKDKFFPCCRLIQAGNESGGLLLMLLVNLTKIDGFVDFIIESNAGYFINVTMLQLVTSKNLPSTISLAIWPFLKNLVMFDAGRKILLENLDIYIGPILYPIAGPEEMTQEELRCVPSEVQYLPKSKIRAKDKNVRECILDILYSLCRFKNDRERLRNFGVYEVLKYYHLAEKNEDLLEKIENLVNILIRKEDSEIEVDDLLEGLSLDHKIKDPKPAIEG